MDKLVVRMLPLMKASAFIGALAGVAIAGLGVGRMLGMIDMGAEFEAIEPLWMIAGGVILFGVFVAKLWQFKTAAAAAKERLNDG